MHDFLRYYEEVSAIIPMSLEFRVTPYGYTVSICTVDENFIDTEIIAVSGENEDLVFSRALSRLQKWVKDNNEL